MKVVLDNRVQGDLDASGKSEQFSKQVKHLSNHGTSYNSLNFEVVRATKKYKDPYRVYSFRVSGSWRAYCTKITPGTLKVILVDNHKYPFK